MNPQPETKRRVGLALAVVLIAGAIVAIEQPWAAKSQVPPPPTGIPAGLLRYPGAPDFGAATGWIHSGPVDLVALRGRVVLVDFWTYSCVNCIRTFPYITEWWDRYRDDGLVVIGVHTPEFRFERERENVEEAAERYGLTYPIAQDNDYGIWQAYHNRYWPAHYLIDEWGRIRYTHFGEGAYAQTEQRIRDLLEEAGHAPNASHSGLDAERSNVTGITPELYAGTSRARIGNPEGHHPGQTIHYERPADIRRDRIWLEGTWANGDEAVTAMGNATVLLRFYAGAANFVARGAQGGCVAVELDGVAIPVNRSGADVDHAREPPCILLDSDRSYDLYAGPAEEHLAELAVPDGFELYTFAFSKFPMDR